MHGYAHLIQKNGKIALTFPAKCYNIVTECFGNFKYLVTFGKERNDEAENTQASDPAADRSHGHEPDGPGTGGGHRAVRDPLHLRRRRLHLRQDLARGQGARPAGRPGRLHRQRHGGRDRHGRRRRRAGRPRPELRLGRHGLRRLCLCRHVLRRHGPDAHGDGHRHGPQVRRGDHARRAQRHLQRHVLLWAGGQRQLRRRAREGQRTHRRDDPAHVQVAQRRRPAVPQRHPLQG